ncbi:MAG: hypothetical protein AAFP84_14530, partial [Actinomycetota bacterium]
VIVGDGDPITADGGDSDGGGSDGGDDTGRTDPTGSTTTGGSSGTTTGGGETSGAATSGGSTGNTAGTAGGATSGTTTGDATSGTTTGGTTDSTATTGGATGATGSTGGSTSSSTSGSTGDSTGSTGGSTGGGLTAQDIDTGALLDATELTTLGLGATWQGEAEIEPADLDQGVPCGLAVITAVDQLYADFIDDIGREFEQRVTPGQGAEGVAAYGSLASCSSFVDDAAGGTVRVLEVAVPSGASAANGVVVEQPDIDEWLTWLAADVDGTFVGVFHLGEAGQASLVIAAFEQLVADVAAAI